MATKTKATKTKATKTKATKTKATKTKATKTKATAKIKPLSDRVVVRPLEDEEQTRGGLYIPDTAKEKPQQGEIMAVGPGKVSDQGERIGPDVKAGDKVLYGKYSGSEVTVDGEEYLILRESDVLAILN